MRRIGTRWIIHGFAALHVAAMLLCVLLGWPDSLLLTALTMALTVTVCYRRNLTVEFTAICVLLVNILQLLQRDPQPRPRLLPDDGTHRLGAGPVRPHLAHPLQ